MEEQLVKDFFVQEKSHWWHKAKRAMIRSFICEKRMNVLVAGVGGGMICQELKQDGHELVGLDISKVACDYVEKTTGVTVLCEDLEKPLVFKEGSFDLVILADVLEHLDNEVLLLNDIRRCLKPGGMLIVTVPAYAHMWSHWDERAHHKRRYCTGTLRQRLIDAQYDIKKLSYCYMLLYLPVYVYRKILLPRAAREADKSDFAVMPYPIVGMLFDFYYALERIALRYVNLPFGLSVFAVGIKRSF